MRNLTEIDPVATEVTAPDPNDYTSAPSPLMSAVDAQAGASGVDLVEQLRRVAATVPRRRALVGHGFEPVSYSQLVEKVDGYAEVLSNLGVQPDVAVAVCLGASHAAAVSVFALLQIGATVVPLPLDQPIARTRTMAQDTKPQVVLVPADSGDAATVIEAVQEVVPGALVVSLSADADDWKVIPNAFALVAGSANLADSEAQELSPQEEPAARLAYVMFTSGSTGRPKGVMVTHDNLRTFLRAWTDVVGSSARQFAGDGATWLWLTTLSFDPVIVELIWALTNGATVVIPERTATGPDVAGAITEFGVTHLQCTPTRASLFLADPVERAALGKLSHLMVGGEVLSPALAQSLLDTGVPRLTNIYGPTETTVWAFSFDVKCNGHAGSASGSPVALGRATPGTIAVVVDTEGVVVPPGTEGELWLGGNDVALGYIGNQSLTSHSFVDPRDCHPSVMEAVNAAGGSARIYKTGDLVTVGDGVFWFGGRRDGQVKIRGHRVETSAVEAAIESFGAVQRAAVVAVGEDGSPERRLVAFFTSSLPATEGSPAHGVVQAVRAHSATLLSAAHLPTDWHVVPSFPLTATGKIDRRALIDRLEQIGGPPDVQRSGPRSEREHGNGAVPGMRNGNGLPPVAQLTAHLSALFADVIGKPVGPDDDFFAAGGDSVGAVELFARLVQRFGQRFPLRLLAEAGSPVLLADRLHTYEQGGDGVLVDFGRPARSAPSLYLVHGAGGTVIGFAELAAALAPDFNLVGVQAIGTDGVHAPDLSVAAMADRYAAAIADRHRSAGGGPLQIGGYSDGGLIAVSTAALLAQRGFSVLPVVLLDAFLGTHVSTGVAGKLGDASRNLADHPGRSLVGHLYGAWRGWRVRHTTLQRDHQLAERMADLGHRDLFDVVLRACAEVGANPPEVRPAVVLIRCKDYNPFERHDYTWLGQFAQSVSVTWTSGHHLSMLRGAHAAKLAKAIRTVAVRERTTPESPADRI